MGDPRRFQVFGDFLKREYPWASSVCDVAGGKGFLSHNLAVDQGFSSVTCIDTRKDPRSYSQVRRNNRMPFTRRIEPFKYDAGKFDLVVGMHPDGATEEIAKAAEYARVAVVPCCFYWSGWITHQQKGNFTLLTNLIRETWDKLGIKWREERLGISGKNLVLFT